jgi:uncharacterized phage protein (predicted DNA packaging)
MYLTLDEIKRQLNIDLDYDGDDEILTLMGESAEDIVSNLIDTPLDELAAENGELPPGVRHALRMLIDWEYSQQRGSSSESLDVPTAIYNILKLYRSFK